VVVLGLLWFEALVGEEPLTWLHLLLPLMAVLVLLSEAFDGYCLYCLRGRSASDGPSEAVEAVAIRGSRCDGGLPLMATASTASEASEAHVT